jgi:hypothetical protein
MVCHRFAIRRTEQNLRHPKSIQHPAFSSPGFAPGYVEQGRALKTKNATLRRVREGQPTTLRSSLTIQFAIHTSDLAESKNYRPRDRVKFDLLANQMT